MTQNKPINDHRLISITRNPMDKSTYFNLYVVFSRSTDEITAQHAFKNYIVDGLHPTGQFDQTLN